MIGSSRGLRPSRAHPEAEGTDSPPHHPFSDSAEILRISGRGICNEAIFSPGRQAPLRKNQHPRPTRRSPTSIGSREGSHPLELSRGCSDGDFGFRRSRLFFCGRCFRRRERGALRSPTSPRGTGCERVATLSRSPGVGVGALLPYIPSGTGCERVATLSRSPGVGVTRNLVSGDAGDVLLKDFVSDDAGRGALCSPIPPRGTGARGLRTSRALPGMG